MAKAHAGPLHSKKFQNTLILAFEANKVKWLASFLLQFFRKFVHCVEWMETAFLLWLSPWILVYLMGLSKVVIQLTRGPGFTLSVIRRRLKINDAFDFCWKSPNEFLGVLAAIQKNNGTTAFARIPKVRQLYKLKKLSNPGQYPKKEHFISRAQNLRKLCKMTSDLDVI